MENFADVINLWPSPAVLASDLGEEYETVRKWRQRNSIPSNKWEAVIQAAKRRQFKEVNERLLVSLASK